MRDPAAIQVTYRAPQMMAAPMRRRRGDMLESARTASTNSAVQCGRRRVCSCLTNRDLHDAVELWIFGVHELVRLPVQPLGIADGRVSHRDVAVARVQAVGDLH